MDDQINLLNWLFDKEFICGGVDVKINDEEPPITI